MKVLDCTLRDGGYYTNWDFDKETVDTYIEAFNHLPVDYLEIGYRSNPLNEYLGEYFYLPEYVLKKIRERSNKKLAVILNEKDIRATDSNSLLFPCQPYLDMVRIAVAPDNFKRALKLGESVKKLGLELCFNVMYMSEWENKPELMTLIPNIDGIVDYFYMVDSFGGVFPEDVRKSIDLIRSKTDVKLGFHGHNNLEMALANTLTAIDEGVDIVDATITGMGRGAGNLKMELLLTVLSSQGKVDFDYNWLSKVTDVFSDLQKQYEWGTNLPYMVSGANSVPQGQVMDWVSKRYYSFNSIIRALSNQSDGIEDNYDLPEFESKEDFEKILIVGGGPSVNKHNEVIQNFLKKETSNICVIHASSRNVPIFNKIDAFQIHALSGNEGYRLENTFSELNANNRVAILPPYPRKMGTYIPEILKDQSYQLSSFQKINSFMDSITCVCVETALTFNPEEIIFVGYDGYEGDVSSIELDLFNENEGIFNLMKNKDLQFYSLTPTKYDNLPIKSAYSQVL